MCAAPAPPHPFWLAHPSFSLPPPPPQQVVYVGLRDLDDKERLTLRKHNIKAFSMQHVDKYGVGKVMEMTLDHLLERDPNRPLHLSYDIDAVDPGIAPSTGTIVRGGLTYRRVGRGGVVWGRAGRGGVEQGGAAGHGAWPALTPQRVRIDPSPPLARVAGRRTTWPSPLRRRASSAAWTWWRSTLRWCPAPGHPKPPMRRLGWSHLRWGLGYCESCAQGRGG